MKRILIADCKQEISSFNPLPSHYENFLIHHGDGLYVQRVLDAIAHSAANDAAWSAV